MKSKSKIVAITLLILGVVIGAHIYGISYPEAWRSEAIAWLENILNTTDNLDDIPGEGNTLQVRSHNTIRLILDGIKRSDYLTDITNKMIETAPTPTFYVESVNIGPSEYYTQNVKGRQIQIIYPKDIAESLRVIGLEFFDMSDAD